MSLYALPSFFLCSFALFIDHSKLSALALRLVPQEPSRWPNWIIATATELSSAGGSTEHVLDFLEIAVEEVNGADLLPTKRCGPLLTQESMSFSTPDPQISDASKP